MKIFALALLAIAGLAASAQTVCAPPAQTTPNFSGNGPGAGGSYPIAVGSTLPVNWTPSATKGCTTYFTIDGTTPTSSSPVYTGQTLQLTKATTILMIAIGPGMTSSQQQGGLYAITVTGAQPPPPTTCGTPPSPLPTSCAPGTSPCVILSCTPPSEPGATVTMFRAVGSSPTFASLATNLGLNCAYIDSAVSLGQSYSYYAETIKNSVPSVPSNTCTVTIPSAPVTPIAPAMAIAFTPATITDATAVTVTINVSGTPAPSGTVTLTSGAFSSAAATLANGSAAITIPASSLDAGTLSFTATYTPDTAGAVNYKSGMGTGNLVVTPVAPSALSGTVIQ